MQPQSSHRPPPAEPSSLVGIQACLEIIFPDENSRPSLRAFHDWKRRGYFPQVKIGSRVFLDPEQVRASLVEKFSSEQGEISNR